MSLERNLFEYAEALTDQYTGGKIYNPAQEISLTGPSDLAWKPWAVSFLTNVLASQVAASANAAASGFVLWDQADFRRVQIPIASRIKVSESSI